MKHSFFTKFFVKNVILISVAVLISLENSKAQSVVFNPPFLESELVACYDIVPADSSDLLSAVNPAYDFYAKFNCEIEQTIDTIFCYDTADSLTVSISSKCSCYVYILNVDCIVENPHAYRVNTYDDSTGLYKKTFKICNDNSAFTRLIVTRNRRSLLENPPITPPREGIHPFGIEVDENTALSYNASSFGSATCTIEITSDLDPYFTPISIVGKLGSNIWKLNYEIEDNFSHETDYDRYTEYNIFTCQSTTDVELFVLDQHLNIIDHITDYVGPGDYDWGTDVRIKLMPDSVVFAVMLLPQLNYGNNLYADSLCPSASGKTDLYLGCKNYLWPALHPLYGEPVFPYMKSDDAIVSDPARYYGYGDYNCFAWAIGCWLASLSYGHVIGAYSYNDLFESLGYTTLGATETNCDIDIWEHNGNKTHASVRSYSNGANSHSFGYAWESKHGPGGARFMHPRYALEDTNQSHLFAYGHVVEHLIKIIDNQQGNFVLQNCEFSDDEFLEIDEMISSLSGDDICYFDNTLDFIDRVVNYFGISNLSILNLYLDEYKDLVSKCSDNAGMLGYAMKKMSEGNYLAAYLIADATKEKNVELAKSFFTREINAINNSNNPKIIPTIISAATRYAKVLLSNQKYLDDNYKEPQKSLSYSNSNDVFSLSLLGGEVQISFMTDRDAFISLIFEDLNGRNQSVIWNHKRIEKGDHKYSYRIDKKGTYIVSLIINGRVYSKKVKL